jgi:hypothetical protein
VVFASKMELLREGLPLNTTAAMFSSDALTSGNTFLIQACDSSQANQGSLFGWCWWIEKRMFSVACLVTRVIRKGFQDYSASLRRLNLEGAACAHPPSFIVEYHVAKA